MSFTRAFAVIAVAALFVGAATAATTEEADAVKSFISKLPFSQRVKKDVAARIQGEADGPVRGRLLAEADICQTLADSGFCEDFKTEATCPSPKCKYDTDMKECDVADTAASEAMGTKMLGSMLVIYGADTECQTKLAAADCTGNCQWSANANKCGITKAAVNTAVAQIGDATLQGMMGPAFQCQMVHKSEADCNADPNCNYNKEPAPNSTTARKLLGSTGDDSEGGCEMKEVVGMTSLARYCPTQFESVKAEALKDPNVSAEEKANLEKAEKDAEAMPPTSSALVSWASLAFAVVACLLL